MSLRFKVFRVQGSTFVALAGSISEVTAGGLCYDCSHQGLGLSIVVTVRRMFMWGVLQIWFYLTVRTKKLL